MHVAPPGVPAVGVAAPQPPSVYVVPVAGPPGPTGQTGGTSFEYHQGLPQAVWVIAHMLGRFPVAWSLFDAAGRLCDGYTVEHVDFDHSRVSMDIPTAGIIRLI